MVSIPEARHPSHRKSPKKSHQNGQIKRLKQLGLTTLEARRQRGDLIQYFKFSKNINHISWYHPNSLTNSLNESGAASSTRGHKQRLRDQIAKRTAPQDRTSSPTGSSTSGTLSRQK